MERLQLERPREGQKVLEGLYADIGRRIASSPRGLCPVDMSLNFLRLCHAQSCGKCTPCRVGLGALAKLLEDVLDGRADEKTVDLIERTAHLIMMTADCAIG
ncbi:MAG: glutamate synthase, partial [Lachnospiraceae bacterium]|nr:glutamate synthase [Lachnospiraceae bacterium]